VVGKSRSNQRFLDQLIAETYVQHKDFGTVSTGTIRTSRFLDGIPDQLIDGYMVERGERQD